MKQPANVKTAAPSRRVYSLRLCAMSHATACESTAFQRTALWILAWWGAMLLGTALLAAALLGAAALAGPPTGDVIGDGTGDKVSFCRDVYPVLQTHCLGCHQSAKASGEYVMTSFTKLLTGGESGSAAIVPGDPDQSYLLELITPSNGQADMPSGKPPLDTTSIDLIRRWIQQGAVR